MNMRRILLPLAVLALGGCAITNYTLVAPSLVSVDDLQLSPGTSWNRAPTFMMPFMRSSAEVWTHDGVMLDRIMIIPAIPDGGTVFVDKKGQSALPPFRANMLPNEIQEMTESSLAKFFGEGDSTVSGMNLRPHRFGAHNGLLFDIEAAVADGPDYKGLVGAFKADERLYLMIYFAADPHYYDKYLAEASSMISGASLKTSAEPSS